MINNRNQNLKIKKKKKWALKAHILDTWMWFLNVLCKYLSNVVNVWYSSIHYNGFFNTFYIHFKCLLFDLPFLSFPFQHSSFFYFRISVSSKINLMPLFQTKLKIIMFQPPYQFVDGKLLRVIIHLISFFISSRFKIYIKGVLFGKGPPMRVLNLTFQDDYNWW